MWRLAYRCRILIQRNVVGSGSTTIFWFRSPCRRRSRRAPRLLLCLAHHVVKRPARVLVPASVKLCNLPSEALCHEAPDKPSARRSACACQTTKQTIARDQSQAGKQPESRVRLSVRSAGSLLRPGAVAIGQPHRNPNYAKERRKKKSSIAPS